MSLFKETTNNTPAAEKVYHIMAAPRRRQVVSNHWPIDCLLNSIFRPASKTTSKLQIIILLCGEPTLEDCLMVVSLPSGPVMRKSALCHNVIMNSLLFIICIS